MRNYISSYHDDPYFLSDLPEPLYLLEEYITFFRERAKKLPPEDRALEMEMLSVMCDRAFLTMAKMAMDLYKTEVNRELLDAYDNPEARADYPRE